MLSAVATAKSTSRPVLYSDGLYHDPAKVPEFTTFINSFNLLRLEEVISSLRWENYQLKERLMQ